MAAIDPVRGSSQAARRATARVVVGGRSDHRLLHLLQRSHLDLADARARRAVDLAQFLEGLRLVLHIEAVRFNRAGFWGQLEANLKS
jgi:hypothetical protein